MAERFLGRKKKISVSQIDLKLFFEFYKKYICQYLYNYTLEDDSKIIVRFEEDNFSHLLGLHKFKSIKDYENSKKINEDILKEKITFKGLRLNEENVILKNGELLDRLTFFPVLKTLLENVDTALKYDINVIWNSKIEFSFLLRTDKISILVYLAVKEIKNNKKICVPVSFLVDRNDRFSKMNLEKLTIKCIDIKAK